MGSTKDLSYYFVPYIYCFSVQYIFMLINIYIFTCSLHVVFSILVDKLKLHCL